MTADGRSEPLATKVNDRLLSAVISVQLQQFRGNFIFELVKDPPRGGFPGIHSKCRSWQLPRIVTGRFTADSSRSKGYIDHFGKGCL